MVCLIFVSAMIDELNVIYTDKKRIEQQLRAYFEEMPEISEKQVQERTTFAEKIFALMMLFMAMVDSAEMLKEIQDIDYYITMIVRRYEDAVEEQFGTDITIAAYISEIARSIVNTTFENPDNSYTLSEDRAFDIAVNESSTIVGNQEFQNAIKSGKKQKQWISEKDNRVRRTHVIADGTTIPIQDYFVVGDSQMLYPHDSVNGSAKEVVNCRCHVKYL